MTERTVRRHTVKERLSAALGISAIIASAYLYFAEYDFSAEKAKKHISSSPEAARVKTVPVPESFHSEPLASNNASVSEKTELPSISSNEQVKPTEYSPTRIVQPVNEVVLSNHLTDFAEALKSTTEVVSNGISQLSVSASETVKTVQENLANPKFVENTVNTLIEQSESQSLKVETVRPRKQQIINAINAELALRNWTSAQIKTPEYPQAYDPVVAEGLVHYQPEVTAKTPDPSMYPPTYDPVVAEGLVGYQPEKVVTAPDPSMYPPTYDPVVAEGLVNYQPQKPENSPAVTIEQSPTVAVPAPRLEKKKIEKSLPPIPKIAPRIKPDGSLVVIKELETVTHAPKEEASQVKVEEVLPFTPIEEISPPAGPSVSQDAPQAGGGGLSTTEMVGESILEAELEQFSFDTVASNEEYKQQQEFLYTKVPQQEYELRMKYEGMVFSSVDEMPADLKSFFLGTIESVADKYNVPPSVLLSYLYAEQMGGGFRFEFRISSAQAAGEGQITPGHWNGWTDGKPDFLFTVTADGTGSANDFDGNGFANVYQFSENLAASAQDISGNGLTIEILKNLTPDQREQKYKDALAIYNSGKIFVNSPAETRPYVKIGLGFLKEFDPGFFEAEFSPKGQLLETTSPAVTVEAAPAQGQLTIIEAYAKMYENSFGVPFTETEEKYVLAQEDILKELEKTGDVGVAVLKIYDRQASAYMANPDNYPYYRNLEYVRVQQDALVTVGAQLGSEAEIKGLLDWSAAQNEGVLNLDQVKQYLESLPQAQVYDWLQQMGPTVLGREMTRAEMGWMLNQAYQAAGVSFVDMPGTNSGLAEKMPIVIQSLRSQLASLPEFTNAPELLLIKETAPLGPMLVDESGSIVPFGVRETKAGINDGEVSPWGEHARIDHLALHDMTDIGDNWYGIDIVRAENDHLTVNTTVISPIEGVAEVVGVGRSEASDGAGNSLVIRGTGKYEGMYLRILHLGSEKLPKQGDTLKVGDEIGVVGDVQEYPHLHVGLSLQYNGEYKGKSGTFYLPLPTVLTFSKDSGLQKTWESGYDDPDILDPHFSDQFGMKEYLTWFGPWDFPQGYWEHFKNSYETYYASSYASELPKVTQSWLQSSAQEYVAVSSPESPVESLTEETEELTVSDQYLASYSQKFVETFGVPYTGTEQQYAISQQDIYQEAENSGEYQVSADRLIERQIAAYRSQPENWPYFFSDEAIEVQRAALEKTGSFIGTKAGVEHVIQWSTQQNGSFDAVAVENYFSGTDQAVIKNLFIAQFELTVGRAPTKAEVGVYLAQAYADAGMSFIRLPGEPDTLTEETQTAILNSLHSTLTSLSQ